MHYYIISYSAVVPEVVLLLLLLYSITCLVRRSCVRGAWYACECRPSTTCLRPFLYVYIYIHVTIVFLPAPPVSRRFMCGTFPPVGHGRSPGEEGPGNVPELREVPRHSRRTARGPERERAHLCCCGAGSCAFVCILCAFKEFMFFACAFGLGVTGRLRTRMYLYVCPRALLIIYSRS